MTRGHDKSTAHKIHTKRRILERYGFDINDEEYRQLVNHIKKPHKYPNKQHFIEKQSNRVSLWKVKFRDVWIIAVYDKSRSNIVTVLPNEESR